MRTAILVSREGDGEAGEALGLCGAAGYEVLHVMRQRRMDRPRYGIGEGALERLRERAEAADPDVIVYDEVLRPSQNYNLASRLRRNVLDREALILEIFEGRASSAESRLQVRLAKMRYELSRAREKVRLAKAGEQPGFMGIGKFGVDAYYDDIRHRMNAVRRGLAKAGRQRELHRRGRRRAGWATASLAGYTAAGKTTLFNALAGGGGEEGPGPFTTLSTTVRRAELGGRQMLLSDTVGFISKLPAYMVDAFRSTLEEMVHADAVVLVVDASDPPAEAARKHASCARTLSEMGVGPERVVVALNKADLAGRRAVQDLAGSLGLGEGDAWAAVSAATGRGCAELGRAAAAVASAAPAPGRARPSWRAGPA